MYFLKNNLTTFQSLEVIFSLSDINTQLHLVNTYLDPIYEVSDLSIALNDIIYDFDGKLDSVYEMRARYRANTVSLWINTDGYSLSWIGPISEYVFLVVSFS